MRLPLLLIGTLAFSIPLAKAGMSAETAKPRAGAAASSQQPATGQAVIDVGRRKQLMIDDRFVARSQNIVLRMNRPTKLGKILGPDRPWETNKIGFPLTVLHDQGEYKMWYMTRDAERERHHCFARSKDGLVWERPDLGLVEYQGSKQNNILPLHCGENTVFIDPKAPPDARYKSISMEHWPDPEKGGLYVHSSPDGIHWNVSQKRVFPLAPDTANQMFYDTRLDKYVAYVRVWNKLRKVGRIEIDDPLRPWPFEQTGQPNRIWGKDKVAVPRDEVPNVFGYDEQDPPDSDHYNAACVQYPWADDAYFLFPSAYRHFPKPPKGKFGNDGYLDVQMAVSRDGVHWTRLSREPYAGLGLVGQPDSCQLYMGVGIVRSGDNLLQYYAGFNVTHGRVMQSDRAGCIMLLAQRPDGFVSADADYQGGEIVTPPLRFSGSRLVLNIDCGAMGTCRIAVLGPDEEPLPGFAVEDCDEIGGNAMEATVAWKGSSDLSALRGQAVRLRFAMRSTRLFAFQFVQ